MFAQPLMDAEFPLLRPKAVSAFWGVNQRISIGNRSRETALRIDTKEPLTGKYCLRFAIQHSLPHNREIHNRRDVPMRPKADS